MNRGTVSWYNDSKGYGFIRAHGTARDVFAHYTAIETEVFKTLAEGQQVEFEAVETAQGPKATLIRKLPSREAYECRQCESLLNSDKVGARFCTVSGFEYCDPVTRHSFQTHVIAGAPCDCCESECTEVCGNCYGIVCEPCHDHFDGNENFKALDWTTVDTTAEADTFVDEYEVSHE